MPSNLGKRFGVEIGREISVNPGRQAPRGFDKAPGIGGIYRMTGRGSFCRGRQILAKLRLPALDRALELLALLTLRPREKGRHRNSLLLVCRWYVAYSDILATRLSGLPTLPAAGRAWGGREGPSPSYSVSSSCGG